MNNFFVKLGTWAKATIEGKLLFKLKFDRFFPHIISFVCFAFLNVFIGIKSQMAMLEVEKNKETINELKNIHAEKTIKLASFARMSTVEKLLKQKGSDVGFPQKNVTIIDK